MRDVLSASKSNNFKEFDKSPNTPLGSGRAK